MFEICLYGDFGKGVASGAAMVSIVESPDCCHARTSPSFGTERMGAPVRIVRKPLRLRQFPRRISVRRFPDGAGDDLVPALR